VKILGDYRGTLFLSITVRDRTPREKLG